MVTISFVLLKWGTGKLDSLLFFVPLVLLLILWGSSHLIRYIKLLLEEHKELIQLFSEDEPFENIDTFLLQA